MWENFNGIQEEQMLKTLPRSLRLEIKSHLFKNLIENWEAFPIESQGAIETVIRMLKLIVYPQYEYIITAGEVADEMYFIVQGVVEIRDTNNAVINTLRPGQHFGEMALLNPHNRVRMAHAVSQTMVSLAVLTRQNFVSICEYFPSFKTKINLLV
jgi:signal-transduction protein with cAMP-binding, CBS, and nucleotidyltransferase domain